MNGLTKKSISIVYLVFNEEGNIRKLVERSISELEDMPYEYKILIVNNASTDNTGKIIDELARIYSFIEAIHHPSNLGYAMSTLTGFKKSDGEIVFIIDGDGQHTVADIPSFISRIEVGYDIIFGWKVERNDPAMRLFISRILSFFAKATLGYPYHDINCGFRAVTRQVADDIDIRHKLNAAGPEIYVWGSLHNYRIAEVPVKHFARETGNSVHIPWALPGNILKMMIYMLQLRKELLAGKQ